MRNHFNNLTVNTYIWQFTSVLRLTLLNASTDMVWFYNLQVPFQNCKTIYKTKMSNCTCSTVVTVLSNCHCWHMAFKNNTQALIQSSEKKEINFKRIIIMSQNIFEHLLEVHKLWILLFIYQQSYLKVKVRNVTVNIYLELKAWSFMS